MKRGSVSKDELPEGWDRFFISFYFVLVFISFHFFSKKWQTHKMDNKQFSYVNEWILYWPEREMKEISFLALGSIKHYNSLATVIVAAATAYVVTVDDDILPTTFSTLFLFYICLKLILFCSIFNVQLFANCCPQFFFLFLFLFLSVHFASSRFCLTFTFPSRRLMCKKKRSKLKMTNQKVGKKVKKNVSWPQIEIIFFQK